MEVRSQRAARAEDATSFEEPPPAPSDPSGIRCGSTPRPPLPSRTLAEEEGTRICSQVHPRDGGGRGDARDPARLGNRAILADPACNERFGDALKTPWS